MRRMIKNETTPNMNNIKMPNSSSQSSSPDSNKQSELLSLPPELRNTIYDFVLATGQKLYVDYPPHVKMPNLGFVSKQVRSESFAMFLGSNDFYTCIYSMDKLRQCFRWLSVLEKMGNGKMKKFEIFIPGVLRAIFFNSTETPFTYELEILPGSTSAGPWTIPDHVNDADDIARDMAALQEDITYLGEGETYALDHITELLELVFTYPW